jgi:AP-1 complex subunit gamma-1
VAHTPELQAYTASRLYRALLADISQEALTLSATWVLGEYSEILVEGGLVDEDQVTTVRRDDDPLSFFLIAPVGV